MLKSSCEKATLKEKRKKKSMFDKLLSQSILVNDRKKVLHQNNIIEYKQLISAARNVDIKSKASLFEKFVVIKNSFIS